MNKKLELYVHIPFCLKKCGYCDFLSVVADDESYQNYLQALLKEIKQRAKACRQYRVVTIFFGGGTPSIWPEAMIGKVMKVIKREFTLLPECEITIEANPGTLTKEKLSAYRSFGINRLSLGLQSADDEELKLLSRVHTFGEFLDGYQMARAVGFDNINVDLMSALPQQDIKSWEETLTKVLALEPEHISAYSLIIEADTPFYQAYGEDGEGLPDEEIDREMYYITKELLKAHGYQRYEISNYSKSGKECQHNIGYWTGAAYLGLGLGASSFMENIRFENPSQFDSYYQVVDKGALKTPEGDTLTITEQMEEFMFLGLRLTKGISLDEFQERFGQDAYQVYGMIFGELAEEDLIAKIENRIALTEKGLDLSNYVMAKFLL